MSTFSASRFLPALWGIGVLTASVFAGTSCPPIGWDTRLGKTPAVAASIVYDDGAGPALYLGGGFYSIGGTNPGFGGVSAYGVAKWNGSAWSQVGEGLSLYGGFDPADVRTMAVFDGDLYIGGKITQVRPPEDIYTDPIETFNDIARWDGTAWHRVGEGFANGWYFGAVDALLVHDDGSGPALYVGGSFTTMADLPGVIVEGIIRWDGSAWSTLGTGGQVNNWIQALASFDDDGPLGSNPSMLYAAGDIPSLDGVVFNDNNIARWNGVTWEPVPGAPTDPVSTPKCMTVFDSDGAGPNSPRLYIGYNNGLSTHTLFRFDGSSWTGVPGFEVLHDIPPFDADITPGVLSMTTVNENGHDVLYVGTVYGLRRHDGQTTSFVGGVAGPDSPIQPGDYIGKWRCEVRTVAAVPTPEGEIVFAGGIQFGPAQPDPILDRAMIIWDPRAADCCPADFNGVNGVTVQDIFDFLTAWLAGNSSADFNHVNGVTVQDIFDFLTAWLAGC